MNKTRKRATPTVVAIDREAIRFNYRQLKSRVHPSVKTLCVVKSDAYGHGAPEVARVLEAEGADFFGVGTVDEGVVLRECGIQKPVLVLLGIFDDFESVVQNKLTPVIYDIEQARRLQEYLEKNRLGPISVQVKVDTGMTRLGVLVRDMDPFCAGLGSLPLIRPEGLLTHLAEASDEAFTEEQYGRFETAKEIFKKHFSKAGFFHIANSQAAIDQRDRSNGETRFVRFGIALYGAYPSEKVRDLIELKPALQWKTRIAMVKKIPPGMPVSYNRTFTTQRESTIGVLPVGYADGYPRVLSNRSYVLVNGQRASVAGIVCMDMMMVDLTDVPGAKVGDEVVLLGRQGGGEIRAEELAALANTISYEIFCRISGRVPRVYI